MNKKILLLIFTICLITVFACALVACSNGDAQQSSDIPSGKTPSQQGGSGHTHSFSSTYSYNSTSHWQNCSCGATQNYGSHIFGAWIVDYDATQYRNGSKHRTCAICGYTEHETIYYQHTHEFGSTYSYDANYHWQECSCGEKQNYNVHSFGAWVVDSNAQKHRTCTVCGYDEFAPMTYTVVWKNWDGTVLETDENVEYGVMPSYNGATPTKPEDDRNTYSFNGWSPNVTSVFQNVEYTAGFSEESKVIILTSDNLQNYLEVTYNYNYTTYYNTEYQETFVNKLYVQLVVTPRRNDYIFENAHITTTYTDYTTWGNFTYTFSVSLTSAGNARSATQTIDWKDYYIFPYEINDCLSEGLKTISVTGEIWPLET